jgi:hypothetical protein
MVLLMTASMPLRAVDLPKYSPDPTVFFLHQITWALTDYPRFLPVYGAFSFDLSDTGIIDEESDSHTGGALRMGMSVGTILPVPSVKWLSFAFNLSAVLDVTSHDVESTLIFDDGWGGQYEQSGYGGGLNALAYPNMGFIFDFAPVTVGVFAGFLRGYTDDDALQDQTAEVDENKITLVPIIKTSQIYWLRYLKYIANYINVGTENLDFGQSFPLIPVYPGGNPLTIKMYYANERYNSIARNWIYGAEISYGQKLYLTLDAGYQDFYDLPDLVTYFNVAPFYKLTAGIDFSKITSYIAANGETKTKKVERGVWLSTSYDFMGFWFGLGVVFKGFKLNMELMPSTNESSAFAFKAATQIYIPPASK